MIDEKIKAKKHCARCGSEYVKEIDRYDIDNFNGKWVKILLECACGNVTHWMICLEKRRD